VEKYLRTKFKGFILRTKNKFGNVLEYFRPKPEQGKFNMTQKSGKI